MAETPSPDSLQVKVAFDRHERQAAQLAAANRGPLLRRPAVTYPVAIVVGLAIVPALEALRRLIHPALPWQASVLTSIVVMVVVALSIKRTARRLEEQQRHEENPDVYTLSDAGLEISGADDLVLMSWSNMTRVHETDRFFLFVAGSEVQYLPKRVLDQERVDFVRALISRHTPPTGKARLLGS